MEIVSISQRLLVLELLSVTFKEGVQHDASLEWSNELFDGEFNEFQSIGLLSGDSYALPKNWSAGVSKAWQPDQTPSHEVLQVQVDVLRFFFFLKPYVLRILAFKTEESSIDPVLIHIFYIFCLVVFIVKTKLSYVYKELINSPSFDWIFLCKS